MGGAISNVLAERYPNAAAEDSRPAARMDEEAGAVGAASAAATEEHTSTEQTDEETDGQNVSLATSNLPQDILLFLLGNWINDARSLGRFRVASRWLKDLVDAAVCMKLPRVKCKRCRNPYVVEVVHPCCVPKGYWERGYWERLANNVKKEKVCRHHLGEWSSAGAWSCCGDKVNSPATGCAWSSSHIPDNRVEAHMLDPTKRYFGRRTWPVFREYYNFVKIMNTETGFIEGGRHENGSRDVRPGKHSFEILVPWRGYDVRGHYRYVCSSEMGTLMEKMRWRWDRLYNCTNPCFKAETPVGTCFWYRDGGMSYCYAMFIALKGGEGVVEVPTRVDDYYMIEKLFTGQDQFRWHPLPGLILAV